MWILLHSKQNRFYGRFLFEVNYEGDAKQILLLLIFSLSCVQIYVAGGFAAALPRMSLPAADTGKRAGAFRFP